MTAFVGEFIIWYELMDFAETDEENDDALSMCA